MERFNKYIFAVSCAVLALTGCSKKERVEIPREKSALVLHALAFSEAGNSTDALDAVTRLKISDPTNEFLYEFERIMLDNMFVDKAEKMVGKGDLKGALDVLEDALKKHGDRLKNTLAAKGRLAQAIRVDSLVELLTHEQNADSMEKNARSLAVIAGAVPDLGRFKAFAEKKIADSAQMRLVEEEKARFLVWCTAVDAARTKRFAEYDSLTALLAAKGAKGAADRLVEGTYYQNRGGEIPVESKKNK